MTVGHGGGHGRDRWLERGHELELHPLVPVSSSFPAPLGAVAHRPENLWPRK